MVTEKNGEFKGVSYFGIQRGAFSIYMLLEMSQQRNRVKLNLFPLILVFIDHDIYL